MACISHRRINVIFNILKLAQLLHWKIKTMKIIISFSHKNYRKASASHHQCDECSFNLNLWILQHEIGIDLVRNISNNWVFWLVAIKMSDVSFYNTFRALPQRRDQIHYIFLHCWMPECWKLREKHKLKKFSRTLNSFYSFFFKGKNIKESVRCIVRVNVFSQIL